MLNAKMVTIMNGTVHSSHGVVLMARTVAGIADIRASAQGKEGVQAFLQKRKPSWLS